MTRKIINYLRNDGGEERNGTMLAIDYQDAFRSTEHRWIKIVMKAMMMPERFEKWFWMFYDKLDLIVTVEGHQSKKIKVRRGV